LQDHSLSVKEVLCLIYGFQFDRVFHVRIDKAGPWVFDDSSGTTYFKLMATPVFFKSKYGGDVLPMLYFKRLLKRVILYTKNKFRNVTFSGIEV